MMLRILLLLAMFAVPSAFAKDATVSGSARIRLSGETSAGDVLFKFGKTRVTGRLFMGTLNRTVSFRGAVGATGKVRVKVAASDGIKGSLKLNFFRAKPGGSGQLSIPGRGIAKIKFSLGAPMAVGLGPAGTPTYHMTGNSQVSTVMAVDVGPIYGEVAPYVIRQRGGGTIRGIAAGMWVSDDRYAIPSFQSPAISVSYWTFNSTWGSISYSYPRKTLESVQLSVTSID